MRDRCFTECVGCVHVCVFVLCYHIVLISKIPHTMHLEKFISVFDPVYLDCRAETRSLVLIFCSKSGKHSVVSVILVPLGCCDLNK
ncbi:hypothetical protein Ahy_A07g033436 isoform C [Arachis hypogaea]|uniref:Uncharacterized protein n=1 Tax=Arachis hypogaea TaxID=3818 RepID=A0A445C966_ARAHY|nr:hypothetical protein Ahy_A07g033436 isoform C [Arachis hypogaea]